MKNFLHLAAGVLLGLLVAWLLGLFTPGSTVPAAPALPSKIASSTVSQPAIITMTATRSAVALPAASAVPAHAPEPTAASASGAAPATKTVQQKVQIQAMVNNLRQLSTAAQQYMMDKGVTQAGYYDLVGTTTNDYIRSVAPVMGEDYTGLFLNQSDTQVMVVAPDGTTAVYNL